MKKLLAAISSLFLWLISNAAWATDFMDTTAINNHRDLSMAYLGQVFGSVGNVLQGTSGQMLGHLFYKLNEGIIIVAGLWLGYTVFTIVLRSAQEGSFMGANKNVALTFLKIAMGFSLLIPNPTTGYSLLQDMVMKVVVEGVGLADQTWAYGLKYINDGGSVWRRPESEGGGSGIISGSGIITEQTTNSILGGASENKVGPGQQIFADAVCMYSSNDNQALAPASTTNVGPAVSDTPSVQYDVVTNDAAHRFEFPGVGNTEPLGPGSNNCGSISWDMQNACTGAGSSDTKCLMAKQTVSQLVINLLPASKKYYCSQHVNAASCMGIGAANVASDNEETFFSALTNYVNIVIPLVQLNTGGAKTAKQFINEAENEGWLSAGRYYWDLAQIQSQYDSISNISSYAPTDPAAPTLSGNPLKDANNARTESLGYITPVLTKIAQWQQAEDAGDGGDGSMNHPGIGHLPFFLSSVIGGVVGDIVDLISQFSTSSHAGIGSDPILFLHRIGMYCIAIAGDIWFGFLGLIAGVMLAAGICNSEYEAWPAMQSILEWIKPLMLILAAGFWGAGFVLGYYVPMYPYIIYIFGIIGWLIAVIEAMVAAPLICFGLTHPEGHDFLGEAKQALMLLLGVFLRPVLMVIGLIAAMILSYVSLRIVIYTFSGFTYDLFYQHAPSAGAASSDILKSAGMLMASSMADSRSLSGLIMSLLVFPLTLIIFTTLVYTVTTQSFSLIFALPDNILRWIGGPMHSSPSAQMAQQLQGAIGSAAQSTSKGISDSKQAAAQRDQQGKQSQLPRGGSGEESQSRGQKALRNLGSVIRGSFGRR